MKNLFRLFALNSKKEDLEQQLEQLSVNKEKDNSNVGFELAKTNILLHSLKTKK